jgi:hypothetical protein
MDLRDKGWGGRGRIHVAQNRDQRWNGTEPSGCIKCWEILE